MTVRTALRIEDYLTRIASHRKHTEHLYNKVKAWADLRTKLHNEGFVEEDVREQLLFEQRALVSFWDSTERSSKEFLDWVGGGSYPGYTPCVELVPARGGITQWAYGNADKVITFTLNDSIGAPDWTQAKFEDFFQVGDGIITTGATYAVNNVGDPSSPGDITAVSWAGTTITLGSLANNFVAENADDSGYELFHNFITEDGGGAVPNEPSYS